MNKDRIVSAVSIGALVGVLLWSGGRDLRAKTNYEEYELVVQVMHLIEEHYVKPVDEHELIEGALEGMLGTLDPHTSYLPRDLFEEVQHDTKGEFEGLGIEITKRDADGPVMVVAPIAGTPAARAGIRAKDQIVAVCPEPEDEKSCKGTNKLNLVEAVKLMRGKRGTSVLIQVMREGWQATQPFTIKRDSIQISSVQLVMVDKKIPYVRLTQFQERAASDLSDKLAEARELAGGEIAGLVLDLRDNPGGLLDQAVQVADLFLDDGLIVYSEGRGGGNRMEWKAQPGGEPRYPMVVLVNGGSASASEIVAGALNDHGRALLVGTETFGKGSVQTIIPLPDKSGLRLTTALYYLPKSGSIQEVRIQPSIEVQPLTEAQVKAMQTSTEERQSFGEVDLEGHLTGAATPKPEAKPAPAPAPKAPTKEEELSAEAAREAEFLRNMPFDAQLTRAVDLLKSYKVFSNLEAPRQYVQSPTPAPAQ